MLKELDEDSKVIALSIKGKSVDADEIILKTGFTAQKVLSSLTILELAGCIGRNNNGKWEITV